MWLTTQGRWGTVLQHPVHVPTQHSPALTRSISQLTRAMQGSTGHPTMGGQEGQPQITLCHDPDGNDELVQLDLVRVKSLLRCA